MNSSEIESSRKKRKRSETSSSPDRSRARSRSRDRKKSKKEKKSRRSKSKKTKRKRSKSKSGKRKNKKDRSRSRSPSEYEEKYNKYQPLPPMDPMMGQYLYYPPHMMGHREPRMRPPMFYPPPYGGEYNVRPMRPPIPMQMIPPITKSIEVPTIEQPTDKIVKDQNFLNSDEKLFESIVNNETSIRTIFEDSQISETYAGTILYKTLKKVLHDPNTIIFDSSSKNSTEAASEYSKIILPKCNEAIRIAIDNISENNSYNRLSIDIGDMSDVKEKLNNYRERNIN
jgi:hypothetical protein